MGKFYYIKKIEDGLNFKYYYLHKAFRLLPVVCISAIVYELLLYNYSNLHGFSWFNQKASLWGCILDCLGIQVGWASLNPGVNNPTWYISVLMLCYIIFYAITYWSKRLKISPCYGYAFMIFIGIGILTYGISEPFLNYDAARGYYPFFWGVLIHVLLHCKHYKPISFRGGIILFITTLIMVFRWDTVCNDINYILTFVYYPIIIIEMKGELCAKIFNCQIWHRLAEISFNVFVWHIPLMLGIKYLQDVFVPQILLNNTSSMLCVTFICFVFGTLSHYLIETPINKRFKLPTCYPINGLSSFMQGMLDKEE